MKAQRRIRFRLLCAGLALALLGGPLQAGAQRNGAVQADENDLVQLDFNDVELSVVIDTIARLTGKNFIYDDRVRGRVTIVSPTKISVEQAYAVFESVLQVKGFTVVSGPGGAIKVIPIREAKETSIETLRRGSVTPVSDRFITRLIPLRYIDAEAITNTLKPLVSKDASMVAYAATNTVILTDSGSNIRRILDILESIDVETYKETLVVLKIRHADAGTMAEQLSEIFGAEVSGDVARTTRRTTRARRTAAAAAPTSVPGEPGVAGKVRILTDERTNSLIVLAARQRMDEIRDVVDRLDVPVTGGGRIHVYYLKHADAEALAETLTSMLSGQAPPSAGRGQPGAGTPQALRAAISELSEGVTVTADAPTNSLVIQASQEGYSTLRQVIQQLDIQRPQVLVEALIMEVDVTDGEELGFNGIARTANGNTNFTGASLTDRRGGDSFNDGSDLIDVENLIGPGLINPLLDNLLLAATRNTLKDRDGDGIADSGSLIQGLIRASASLNTTNIVSAPHILTSDNEEAEIKVGNEIPIVTSRVQSAAGQETGLATSQNIERQDIGVTLRVTPQISEGNSVRLQIFQEITDVNPALSSVTGNPEEVGVSLSKRNIENTVVVADGETVVIGGLLSDDYEDTVNKVPWLGDIPILGWFFKTTDRNLTKINLLVFLTPNIVRSAEELESETIRKREEFWDASEESIQLSAREEKEARERRARAEAAGLTPVAYRGRNPVRSRLVGHEKRYPVQRMLAIEQMEAEAEERRRDEKVATAGPSYSVEAAVFRDEDAAAKLLTDLVDAGYDGTLVSGEANGDILLEVRVGPYDSLEEAEDAAAILRETFGLTPSVQVESR